MMHDFALSANFACFLDFPLLFKPQNMVRCPRPRFGFSHSRRHREGEGGASCQSVQAALVGSRCLRSIEARLHARRTFGATVNGQRATQAQTGGSSDSETRSLQSSPFGDALGPPLRHCLRVQATGGAPLSFDGREPARIGARGEAGQTHA